MIVPSIDLRRGRAVQLVGGREQVLESGRDPVELARELGRYGEVAVIDLDAALGEGDNLELIRRICGVAEVRAGGGIRNERRARALLRAGAARVIIGTACDDPFVRGLPHDAVQIALDHDEHGAVMDHGWRRSTGESLMERMERLSRVAGSLLCTFIDNEGRMTGVDLARAEAIRSATDLPVTVAGGVRDHEDILALDRLGMDAQVGMSLYSGGLDPARAVIACMRFDRSSLLPTVVEDASGQVLMLAYSSPESLERALESGEGVYYSRSRKRLWRKGETSGNTQRLLRVRPDCDRDALLFSVEQTGVACHTGSYGCFGGRRFDIGLLEEVIAGRRGSSTDVSYTARLLSDRSLLLSKIAEESREVRDAADHPGLVWEIADLLYFLLVLAAAEGVDWREILAELSGRRRQA